ncbi:hypothetical protein AURDEDRAFT_181991 [Auricularia subglabra TFB-10046 SS5]|nr:hypothetical protein AURDEDRAFT_181991 [Auricularia subglabra TFB-10046 SS5]
MFSATKLTTALLAAAAASAHIVGIEVYNSGGSHHYARTLGFGGRSSFSVKFLTEAQEDTKDYSVVLGLSNSTADLDPSSIGKTVYFVDLVQLGKTNTSGRNFTVKVPLRKSYFGASDEETGEYTITAAVTSTSGDDGAVGVQFYSAPLNITASK